MISTAPATPAGNVYSHPLKVKAKNIRGEARLPFYSSKVPRAQYWAVRATGGRTGGEPAGQAMAHLLLVEWCESPRYWADRLASHPSLDERVTRLYGDTQERLPLLAIDERTGEVRRGSPASDVRRR